MAKSKRSKAVSLTKVKKRTKEIKEKLVAAIRSAIENYRYCYLLSLQNQRNSQLKYVRNLLKPGRIFYGKNKVIQIALGTTPESEMRKNINNLSNMLIGERCLLFSNQSKQEILKFCEENKFEEFARAGFKANCNITLKEGSDSLSQLCHSFEPILRRLGLHTQLINTKIYLHKDYELCVDGKPITAAQAQILKILGIQLSKFSLKVLSFFDIQNCKFQRLYLSDEE